MGVIYPVPIELTERLFDGKIKVFVKKVAHNVTRLEPKHKVVFYASHGPKALIGEAIIDKVEFLAPEVVIQKYKNALFLSETEFYRYVGARNLSNLIMVLVLKDLKKYPKPILYGNHMPMSGQYLIANE